MNPMLQALIEKRAEYQKVIDETIETVAKEERDAFSDAEDKNVRDAQAKIAELDPRIADLAAMEQRAKAADDLAKDVAATGVRETTAARVVREQRTYSADRHDVSFVTDVFAASKTHNPEAIERLARHAREEAIERRDSTTANYTGFVIPQYLVDQFATAVRAGRPSADAIGSKPLPPNGTSFNFARLTTPTTVAAQNGENTAVSNTDPDDTNVTVSVATIAGYADTSRQSVERGAGVDSLIIEDLVSAYHTELDRQVIRGSGASGQMEGITVASGTSSVAYTDASPTAAELFPKVADAIQRVNALRFKPASLIVMHPRRWGWLLASVDTAGRPLYLSQASYGPQNVAGAGAAAAYGPVGSLLGLPVVTDANIATNLGAGTNEDNIIVCRKEDLLLMEEPSAPKSIAVDQTLADALTVRFVVYGFALFSAARYPQSVSVVSGTGLVAPTF